MTDFSTRLRDIVEAKGVTQSWLAEQANTTEATISRYIGGVHKPNLDIVVRIAQALNVSIDYIMDLSLSPTPYQEPEKEIVVLASAYRRADDRSKGLIWSVLDMYLTPEEKNIHIAAEARRQFISSRIKQENNLLFIDFSLNDNADTKKTSSDKKEQVFRLMEVRNND